MDGVLGSDCGACGVVWPPGQAVKDNDSKERSSVAAAGEPITVDILSSIIYFINVIVEDILLISFFHVCDVLRLESISRFDCRIGCEAKRPPKYKRSKTRPASTSPVCFLPNQ
jgi:hypothetical protein